MPSMYEIYQSHADQYDELIAHEDPDGNLRAALCELLDFEGADVIEFGAGTGRLTELYAERAGSIRCFDRSADMRRRAAVRLEAYSEKMSYELMDHAAPEASRIAAPRADIVLEGWAFGHTVFDDGGNVAASTARLVDLCKAVTRSGGSIAFIETLGTNVDRPAPPGEILNAFYQELEGHHGFEKTVVPTPYRFPDMDTALKTMGFFFGPPMAETVRARGTTEVPEFTGIWSLKV
jgi:SAM-dependent methyltransferase